MENDKENICEDFELKIVGVKSSKFSLSLNFRRYNLRQFGTKNYTDRHSAASCQSRKLQMARRNVK